jgi:hypothetical protein
MEIPQTFTMPATGKYYTRYQIMSFILSDISAMRSESIMSMLRCMLSCYASVVSVLICRANIIYMFNLFNLYVMVYALVLILILIWKLLNYLIRTRQRSLCLVS